jgi:hypothetical protein
MTRRGAIGAGAVLVAAIAGTTLLLSNRERSYDRAFDARVTDPVYRADPPVVLYDEGHRNAQTTTEGYKPFADLLRSDGYSVRVSKQPFSTSTLQGVSILALVLARGTNETEDDAAFSDAEAEAIEAWVRGGGSLLLVTDHWPFGSAAASLAGRFDITMGAGFVQDSTHHEPNRGDSHLVFSEENGLLLDHPVVGGRNEAERVRRVLTFTGQSVRGPAAAVPFLTLSDTATERPPGPPRAQRDGGDLRVFMEYGDPVSAAGRAQGLALEVEGGRVVVLGEAGMLRAQRERDGALVGMNVPGYDNRQLALNIVHWLSRAL